MIKEGDPDVKKIWYSKDVDALLIELMDELIAYAENEGQLLTTDH
jgi:protein associated with RNAse G/E